MQHNHHHRTALLALLLAGLLSLSSCSWLIVERRGESGENSQSTTGSGGTTALPYTPPERPDAAATAKAALEALPEQNFGGASLLIAAAEGTEDLFFPAAEGGELRVEQTARLARNTAVSERYGVSFIPSVSTPDAMFNEARSAELAGLYYADLLLLPASQVGRFTAAGLLRNLRNLPFWSNHNHHSHSGEGGSVNAVYADLGEALLDYDDLPAVYFNRTLAESLGYDLYAEVGAGSWTWERYLEAAAAATELDGVDGHAYSPSDNTAYGKLCLASSGLQLVDTSGELPAVTIPGCIDAADAMMRRLLTSDSLFPARANNAIAPLQSFTVGTLLFCTSQLSYIDWIYDSPAKWGLLPLPKGDVEGSYLTPASADAPVLAVTANNAKFEMTGLIIEALNAASTDVITDAYITERLNHRLRDGESAAMIELIAKSVHYDFASLYASGYPSLAYATTAAVDSAVTGAAWGGASLSALVSARLFAANTELARAFARK